MQKMKYNFLPIAILRFKSCIILLVQGFVSKVFLRHLSMGFLQGLLRVASEFELIHALVSHLDQFSESVIIHLAQSSHSKEKQKLISSRYFGQNSKFWSRIQNIKFFRWTYFLYRIVSIQKLYKII